ncbi:unnamed protein product [Periconia digitata]|uniref:Uncharacterized protein n=1 Tax=Periconia digitata TaxID=1303443 RepID=A0A9W4UGE2_9PLEO|nr:unnamed protein product [Periconia digitata]
MTATELNRLVQHDSKLISPLVMKLIDNLSMHCELRAQLSLLCPKVFPIDDHDISGMEQGPRELSSKEWISFMKGIMRPVQETAVIMNSYNSKLKIFITGIRNAGLWAYPVDKKRTEDRVEEMRRAERDLEMTWQRVDRFLKANMSPESYRFFAFDTRRVARTPPWENVHSIDTSPSSSLPAGLFTLNRKAYKPFSTLFFQPSATDEPGEVPWADFVYSLNAIGLIPEKLFGSSWQFTPDASFSKKVKVDRPINFYQPHSGPKLPYNIARRYGRRLNRIYGLEKSSFVLGK